MNIYLNSRILSVLDELSDEQAGLLFKAIKLHSEGTTPKLDFELSMAFLQLESHMTVAEESVSKKEELFNVFWETYNYKVGRKKTVTKWNRLSLTTMNVILEKLPLYIESTPDIKFRKQPLTYLNGEHWLDEIPTQERKVNDIFKTSQDSDIINELDDEKERNRREAEILIKSMYDERI
jgi:hypothetical protein